jgi:hypothetical protein
MNRKRDEKAAKKDERKKKLTQNLSKTPNFHTALLEQLNKLGDDDRKRPAKKDKDGKDGREFDHLFYNHHREEDLGYLNKDLSKVDINVIKRAMRFDDDDLRLANRVPMLFTREEVEKMAGKKKIKISDEWVVKLAELKGFMAKED